MNTLSSTTATPAINDVRVRSVIKRFRLQGFAVWVYLRDATAASPAGVPADETSLGVIADFFSVKPETVRAVVDYCLTVRLLTAAPDGALLPAEPCAYAPAPAGIDASAANSATAAISAAESPAAATAPSPAGKGATATPSAAQPSGWAARAAAPIVEATAAPARAKGSKQQREEEVEYYLDGNVCRDRPARRAPSAASSAAATAAPAPAAVLPPSVGDGADPTAIETDVPLWHGNGNFTDEELANSKAMKICQWWNTFADGCPRAVRLTEGLAARLRRFVALTDSASVGLYDATKEMCRYAVSTLPARRAADCPPPSIDDTFSDDLIDRYIAYADELRDTFEAFNPDAVYTDATPEVEIPGPNEPTSARDARINLRRRRLADAAAEKARPADDRLATPVEMDLPF